jgi:bacterial leucyl aminopeptidase
METKFASLGFRVGFWCLALASFHAKTATADTVLLTSSTFVRGIPKSEILATNESTKTVILKSSLANEAAISKNAHLAGRCGGYEKISLKSEGLDQPNKLLQQLESLKLRKLSPCKKSKEIIKATKSLADLVSATNIESHVRWYSSFKTRYHRSKQANVPVMALKSRIEALINGRPDIRVETITHQNTPQKSIRVVIGSAYPNAAPVIMGGHLDSINGWGFGDPHAPGADDNASGVGALLEAIRILSLQPNRPNHDIIVYLYAGEEAGLLGSSEIAKQTRHAKGQVRGVLQLDMTMFPGDGPFVISSMTDFTDPRLRKWLRDFNEAVLQVKILDDECGYGCSDHASWHRQGYATLMPFESSFTNMNKNIHTARDVVDARSNFEHAAIFAKIAVGFALSSPDTNACE